jgi:hypothetical protein
MYSTSISAHNVHSPLSGSPQETCAEESSPLVRPPLGDSTLHPGVKGTQFSIYVAGDTNWPRISLEERKSWRNNFNKQVSIFITVSLTISILLYSQKYRT